MNKWIAYIFLLLCSSSEAAMYFPLPAPSTGYVDCGNGPALQINGDITMSAWVHPIRFNASERMFSKLQSGPFNGYEWQVLNTAGMVVFLAANNGTLDSTGTILPLNTWSHFCTTYSSATRVATIYLNGQRMTAKTFGAGVGIGTSANNLQLMRYPQTGTVNSRGYMDDVRIYSRVLSAAEISNLAQSRSRYQLTDGLALWVPLDDGIHGSVASGTVKDLSRHKNSCTATGNPVWQGSTVVSYP